MGYGSSLLSHCASHRIFGYLFGLDVVSARPKDVMDQVRQVLLNRIVVYELLKVTVEVLIVLGFCFEQQGTAGQEERDPVCSNSAINADLFWIEIEMLQRYQQIIKIFRPPGIYT